MSECSDGAYETEAVAWPAATLLAFRFNQSQQRVHHHEPTTPDCRRIELSFAHQFVKLGAAKPSDLAGLRDSARETLRKRNCAARHRHGNLGWRRL